MQRITCKETFACCQGLTSLREELHEVLRRYGELPAEPGAEQILVNLHAFPRRPDPAPDPPEEDAK